MQLSPLTRNGLAARAQLAALAKETPSTPEMVIMYRCPTCEELHDWESSAADCCADGGENDEDDVQCPVCGSGHSEHRQAADCCLWKDLAAPTRWFIADAVEAGADWREAIAKATGEAA